MDRAVLILVLADCSGSPDPVDGSSVCPAPDEPCMNAENHAACLEVEADCSGSVLFLESCPLQFACSD